MELIINADDFGWDLETNQGILMLCQAQKIRGVSIMANFAEEEWVQKLLPFQNTVRLGLHVVLNEGMPLLPPREIPSLVDVEGKFYASNALWKRYLMGKVKQEHIQKEVFAQAGRLRDLGVVLSHADSHQHIHHFPFLGNVILTALRRADIKSVRNSIPSDQKDFRRKLLYCFCRLTKRNLRSFSHNDVLVTYLASNSTYQKQSLEELCLRLASRNVQKAELMCHPALADREGSYLRRKSEFDFLLETVL